MLFAFEFLQMLLTSAIFPIRQNGVGNSHNNIHTYSYKFYRCFDKR